MYEPKYRLKVVFTLQEMTPDGWSDLADDALECYDLDQYAAEDLTLMDTVRVARTCLDRMPSLWLSRMAKPLLQLRYVHPVLPFG